jgi:phosphoribosylaminoimidazolecarboxamide formyltransferase/IMP cyclohydrolase
MLQRRRSSSTDQFVEVLIAPDYEEARARLAEEESQRARAADPDGLPVSPGFIDTKRVGSGLLLQTRRRSRGRRAMS